MSHTKRMGNKQLNQDHRKKKENQTGQDKKDASSQVEQAQMYE